MTINEKIGLLIIDNKKKIKQYTTLMEKQEKSGGFALVYANMVQLHIATLNDANDVLKLLLEMNPEPPKMSIYECHINARATLYPGKTLEEVQEILKNQNIYP